MKRSSIVKLYEIMHIPVFIYNVTDKEIICRIPENNIFHIDNEMFQELMKYSKMSTTPTMWLEDEVIYYGCFVFNGNVWGIGPFCRNILTEERKKFFNRKHHYKEEVSVMNELSAATYISMLFAEAGGQEIKPDDILDVLQNAELLNIEKELERYELERSELSQSHQDMGYENRLLEIIASGNMEQIKEYSYKVNASPMIGIVAKDSKKRMEYLTVSLITLISRTAVNAGVDPQDAFNLSDIFLQKIERCNSAHEIAQIGLQATFDFTKLVNEYQNSKNYYVELCKDIINKKLRIQIQISEIAIEIGISREYLSRKFKEIEGMTIQQYIMKQRCKHVANMLKYSEYSISEIAQYFNFASQSHLSMQFKKYYGMTPHQYKMKNHYSSK